MSFCLLSLQLERIINTAVCLVASHQCNGRNWWVQRFVQYLCMRPEVVLCPQTQFVFLTFRLWAFCIMHAWFWTLWPFALHRAGKVDFHCSTIDNKYFFSAEKIGVKPTYLVTLFHDYLMHTFYWGKCFGFCCSQHQSPRNVLPLFFPRACFPTAFLFFLSTEEEVVEASIRGTCALNSL